MLNVSAAEAKAAQIVADARTRAEELMALRAACKESGVTQEAIARAAKVSRPLVNNVFAGRNSSRNVIETARKLVARRQARRKP